MNNINELLINSINFYFNNIYIKYFKYIQVENKDISINNNNIYFNNENNDNVEGFEYQLLGIYNTKNKLWIWSWELYNIESYLITISKNLLNYGLKLELINNDMINEHLFLKSLLVNSRFTIGSYIELDNILYIISYIMKKQDQFIYKYTIKLNNKEYLYLFFVILISNNN